MTEDWSEPKKYRFEKTVVDSVRGVRKTYILEAEHDITEGYSDDPPYFEFNKLVIRIIYKKGSDHYEKEIYIEHPKYELANADIYVCIRFGSYGRCVPSSQYQFSIGRDGMPDALYDLADDLMAGKINNDNLDYYIAEFFDKLKKEIQEALNRALSTRVWHYEEGSM